MLEDIRECPGTTSLAASWVLVFALMHLVQWSNPAPAPPASLVGPFPILTATSHRFGDMTWAEVRHGEPWRAVTATFVHYSLLHLGMNLLGIVKLGRLIEPWYGPGPFVAICLAIGGLGNLFGGALRQFVDGLRPWFASSMVARVWPGVFDRFLHGGPAGAIVHTGGGSTIVLGLLGLCAVVGWRSRTRIGFYLRDQMFMLLGFTAILGIILPNLIDNYGHACGALAGAAIGFAHRPMIRLAGRKVVRRLAWASVALLSVVCLVAAVRDDRREGFGRDLDRQLREVFVRGQVAERTLIELERLYPLYGRAFFRPAIRGEPLNGLDAWAVADLLGLVPSAAEPPSTSPSSSPPAPGSVTGAENQAEQAARDRAELASVVGQLDRDRPDLYWSEPVASDLARLRDLGRAAIDEPPRFEQVYEFAVCWKSAARSLAADYERSKARMLELSRLANRDR